MSTNGSNATADTIIPSGRKSASVADVKKKEGDMVADSISPKLAHTNGMDLANRTERSLRRGGVSETTQTSLSNEELSDSGVSDSDRTAPETVATTVDLTSICRKSRAAEDTEKMTLTPIAETTATESVPVATSPSVGETVDALTVAEAIPSAKKRKWSRPTRVVKLETSDLDDGHDDESEDDKTDSDGGDHADDGDYGRIKRASNSNESVPRRSQKQAKLSEYGKESLLYLVCQRKRKCCSLLLFFYSRLYILIELKRLENIRQNQEMLLQLRIPEALSAVVESVVALKAESSTPGPVR